MGEKKTREIKGPTVTYRPVVMLSKPVALKSKPMALLGQRRKKKRKKAN
jgi:hypothetical protein|tara:strand:+ start:3860 stop:4006 length:147 start_codon:yes stop_codon:yes gene_type:complete